MDDPVLKLSCQEPSTSSSWPPFFSWYFSNKDINSKLSRSLLWGLKRLPMTSRMILKFKEDQFWHQGEHCPTSLQSGTLNVLQVHPYCVPLLDTLRIRLSTWKCQGFCLGVYQCHPWCKKIPCSSSLVRKFQCPPSIWAYHHYWSSFMTHLH